MSILLDHKSPFGEEHEAWPSYRPVPNDHQCRSPEEAQYQNYRVVMVEE